MTFQCHYAVQLALGDDFLKSSRCGPDSENLVPGIRECALHFRKGPYGVINLLVVGESGNRNEGLLHSVHRTLHSGPRIQWSRVRDDRRLLRAATGVLDKVSPLCFSEKDEKTNVFDELYVVVHPLLQAVGIVPIVLVDAVVWIEAT